jgi:putative oxidoreductase
LQRLYSTFADGWPGAALLLQRVVVAVILARDCCVDLTAPPFYPALPHILGACAGALFLIGLWTPIVGALIAATELWVAVHGSEPRLSFLLATTGAATAMLGPGAYSLDARLFGRRHLDL